MNHKRGRAKNARAGCLLCHPNKANGVNVDRPRVARHLQDDLLTLITEALERDYDHCDSLCRCCDDDGWRYLCASQMCGEPNDPWRHEETRAAMNVPALSLSTVWRVA